MKNIPETNKGLMNFCGTRIITIIPHKNYPTYDSKLTAITSRQQLEDAIVFSESKSKKIKDSFCWDTMEEEWKLRCKKLNWWAQDTKEDMYRLHPKLDKSLITLRDLLLSFGGDMACMNSFPDNDTNRIIDYGQFWFGNNIKMMKGRPGQCHNNVRELWQLNKESSRICTGYALSADGMWREHSWLVWIKPRSNQIVETTEFRVGYFGYVMTTEQCEFFCEDWC